MYLCIYIYIYVPKRYMTMNIYYFVCSRGAHLGLEAEGGGLEDLELRRGAHCGPCNNIIILE